MRRKLVLGVSLAALVGGSAAGQQFGTYGTPAGSPKAAPAAIPSGFQPVAPISPSSPTSPAPSGYTPLYGSPQPKTGAYVPPTDGIRPATYTASPAAPTGPAGLRPASSFTATPIDAELPTALPKDHPWLLKPEHGPWFILVKSYVRPAKDSRTAMEKSDEGLSARELAEGLASEVRDNFRVQAFLYEYISDERKAEHRSIMVARQKAANEYVSQIDALEKKAQLQGVDFLRPDNKFRVRKYDARDQIGVLVGGFQTETDASKALAMLRKWPAPKNELLMDFSAIVKPGEDGKSVIEKARLNPYATAFVVRNPASPHSAQASVQRPSLDPFIAKLNEGQPYNLLKASKNWTLAVKSFTAPVEITNKDSDTSLMRKFGLSKGSDVLAAGAEQAEAMAKAIRAMKGPRGEPLNLEAFVLHTRNASLVTIGQFDSPDDPGLQTTKRLLASLKLVVNEKGAPIGANTPSVLFDSLLPMPIPKP